MCFNSMEEVGKQDLGTRYDPYIAWLKEMFKRRTITLHIQQQKRDTHTSFILQKEVEEIQKQQAKMGGGVLKDKYA